MFHLTAAALMLLSLIIPFSSAQAQFVVENLSFGHRREISSSTRTIAGWQIVGEGYTPQMVDDRITLTPQGDGYKRGALWSDNTLQSLEWTADIEFRVTGGDRGSGMLQIWLTKNIPQGSSSSIYNTETFDGLVLVLNQYAGSGGTVRGFLNDGSVRYKTHKSVDSLAFSHCDYSYRNLGRYSNMKIRQTPYYFEVAVDGLTCFKSENVILPTGYRFGITASTEEHPDSFEVRKLIVSTPEANSANVQQQSPPPPPQQQQQQQPPQRQEYQAGAGNTGRSASDPQIVDMLNRLQATVSNVDNIWQEVVNVDSRIANRQKELQEMLRSSLDQISNVQRKVDSIESTVQRIQADIEGRDYQQTLSNLHKAVRDTQSNLLNTLPQSMSQIVSTSAPQMGFFLFIILAFQGALALCYVIYKKRRSGSPKKLL